MAEEGDDDQDSKTEEPTPKRLEEALKQGQVINSREVTSFLMLLTLAIIVAWVFPYSFGKTLTLLRGIIENAHDIDISGNNLKLLLKLISNDILLYIGLPLTSMAIVAILSAFIQQGQINISFEPIEPKLSKISPLAGLKRMFSMKSIVEFLKGILKISIVGTLIYFVIMSDIDNLLLYSDYSTIGIMSILMNIINDIMMAVCVLMATIAAIDYLYQRYEYMKSLMMTKHELKEEYKQTEGNPEIKQKLRSIRIERAQRRMMSNVPTADVVITNPTHFAIALKYDEKEMNAPTVVAKGQDFLALKIKEIAKENKVPIVENPPLARALYSSVELDKEITMEHYQAVAEIISYVYKLKGKKL